MSVEKHRTLTMCEFGKAREMITITQKVDSIQLENIIIQQRFMESDREMIAIKQELDAVTAATLEYFIQKLVQTKS